MVRNFGTSQYRPVADYMRRWTENRSDSTLDEIWIVEHPPVYTRGVSSRDKPRQKGGEIALVDVDRGGKITYHGPGQSVFYLLFDLRRLKLSVRHLIRIVQLTVIEFLASYEIFGNMREGAPGVYVGDAKLAAIGIRIRGGCSYHGFCINVDMDLSPFDFIDPCGYVDLRVTQLKDLGIEIGTQQVVQAIIERLTSKLSYGEVLYSASSISKIETYV
tara:strand:+ start:882 stop:1532 length:651 start_codon:yes stop_codon:yes gene_type:complete